MNHIIRGAEVLVYMVHAFIFLYMQMNKCLLLVMLFLVFGMPLCSKTDVLLTINGTDVSKTEFMSYYDMANKSKPCNMEECFTQFMRAKMKVMDAKRRELDKDDAFLRKLDALKSFLKNEDKYNSAMSELVKIDLFTYRLPQRASYANMCHADNVMNVVCDKLVSGESVDAVLADNKEHGISLDYSGGDWIDRAFLLDEINSEIDKLGVGQVSKPVYSPEGVHIILLRDRNGKYMARGTDSFPDDGFAMKRIEEALLVAEWNRKTILPYHEYTQDALERYFKTNMDKFRWELPHYKGAVIHCSSKKIVSKLKKKLKKRPIEAWEHIINEFRDKTGEVLKSEVGLFEIGKNKYVDKLAFKCGGFEQVEGCPYTEILGKRIDYNPETYKDVYDSVVEEYTNEIECRFFEDLESELGVEMHLDVLKTVNFGGSN